MTDRQHLSEVILCLAEGCFLASAHRGTPVSSALVSGEALDSKACCNDSASGLGAGEVRRAPAAAAARIVATATASASWAKAAVAAWYGLLGVVDFLDQRLNGRPFFIIRNIERSPSSLQHELLALRRIKIAAPTATESATATPATALGQRVPAPIKQVANPTVMSKGLITLFIDFYPPRSFGFRVLTPQAMRRLLYSCRIPNSKAGATEVKQLVLSNLSFVLRTVFTTNQGGAKQNLRRITKSKGSLTQALCWSNWLWMSRLMLLHPPPG